VPSLKRGKNSKVEKIGGRDAVKRERVAVKRRETPEKSSSSP